MGHLLLVTGGTRSGHYAVERAGAWGSRVLYIATCRPADDEMRERVRRHQEERPSTWRTLEPGFNILPAIQGQVSSDGILLDCLTLYVSGLQCQAAAREEARQKVDELCSALRKVGRPAAIVTNEVGWGVVQRLLSGGCFAMLPGGPIGWRRAMLGEVVLMVSGLPMMVKNTSALDTVRQTIAPLDTSAMAAAAAAGIRSPSRAAVSDVWKLWLVRWQASLVKFGPPHGAPGLRARQ